MFYINVLLNCKFTHFGRVNHYLLYLKLILLHRFERFKDAFYMYFICVGSSQENRESYMRECKCIEIS